MFYRADERSSGSGLGLFIARETVEKLKGTITVDSSPGKGSTFTVEIPSLPAPDA
jgi:signal transduction histidine kinase